MIDDTVGDLRQDIRDWVENCQNSFLDWDSSVLAGSVTYDDIDIMLTKLASFMRVETSISISDFSKEAEVINNRKTEKLMAFLRGVAAFEESQYFSTIAKELLNEYET